MTVNEAGLIVSVTLAKAAALLVLGDFIAGNVRAVVAHNWRYDVPEGDTRSPSDDCMKKGLYKMMTLSVMTVMGALMIYPYGISMDPVLHFMGGMLMAQIMLLEFISFHRNLITISFMLGINLPGTTRIVNYQERLESKFLQFLRGEG